MGNLIILCLSNLCCIILTAWILHRQKTGQSPVPTPAPKPGKDENHDADEPVYQKGRPIL